MNYKKTVPFILFIAFLGLSIFIMPIKQVVLFTETRTTKENLYYVPLDEGREFQIRYVHSIHLSDVIESYEATDDGRIRMLSMTYEDLAIGMPAYAGEGETLSITDGLYTLSYDDKIIESFVIRIGQVDADLTFRYGGKEINLKHYLTKGKSYHFSVTKLTFYQLLKGVNLHGER